MVDERNVDFVVSARKEGKSDDEIFDQFEEVGYTAEEIKEIFDLANAHARPTAEPDEVGRDLGTTKRKFHLTRPMKVAIVLGLGVLVAAGLIYSLVEMGI